MLDSNTLFFNHSTSTLIQFLIMCIVWRSYKNNFRGLGFWVFAWGLQFLSCPLFFLRDYLPTWLTVIVANTLVFACIDAHIMGTKEFFESDKRFRLRPWLWAFYLGTLFWFTYVEHNMVIRGIFIYAFFVMAYFFVACMAWTKRDNPGINSSKTVFIICNLLLCIGSLYRFSAALFNYFSGLSVIPNKDYFFLGVLTNAGSTLNLILGVLFSDSLIFALLISIILIIQKRLFVELEDYRDTLLEQVKHRTDVLVKKEKQALVGVMAAGFAHDIVNPLHTITTTLQTVQRGWHYFGDSIEESAQKSDCTQGSVTMERFVQSVPHSLSVIEESCDHISNITGIMKECSAGESEMSCEQFDLVPVLKRGISLFRTRLSTETCHFSATISGKVIPVSGGETQILQVILNLLDNAVRALESPDDFIQINLFKEENRAVLQIRNSGTPLFTSSIDELTEPFYTTRHAEGGTGLGLYMVQYCVDLFQGTFDIYSEERVTTAEVRLPCAE